MRNICHRPIRNSTTKRPSAHALRAPASVLTETLLGVASWPRPLAIRQIFRCPYPTALTPYEHYFLFLLKISAASHSLTQRPHFLKNLMGVRDDRRSLWSSVSVAAVHRHGTAYRPGRPMPPTRIPTPVIGERGPDNRLRRRLDEAVFSVGRPVGRSPGDIARLCARSSGRWRLDRSLLGMGIR